MRITKRKIMATTILVCMMTMARSQEKIALFTRALDSVRVALSIPGMQMALEQNHQLLAENSYGFADLANHIKVTPSTTFRVASITKTFTSTIVMQLVAQGKLQLNAPITQYGIDLGNPTITVRNLFTQTSEGEPGTHFQYNGYRYGRLGLVIDQAAGTDFFRLLMDSIVVPTGMTSTAPGISVLQYYDYLKEHKNVRPYFDGAFSSLAKPYGVDEKGKITATTYLDEFGAFGGLTTNARDLLRYSRAIDQHRFLNAATQQQVFTPDRLKDGTTSPYGLGWFVQRYDGVDYYWHYGQTRGESGIFVKVPSHHLTLAVLTNSIRLSAPFPLGDGDLFMSPVGQLLFRYVINKDKPFESIDYRLPAADITKKIKKQTAYRDFYNKELIVQATMRNSRGDLADARKLYGVYAEVNFTHEKKSQRDTIAAIINAGIDQALSKTFTLDSPLTVHAYGAGENCSADYSSWCDYGWIEDSAGKVVWQMQGQKATPAGGAIKNQCVGATVSLPAGTYTLKYKSDSGHAYDNWDSLPPDEFFWGIVLTK